MSSSFVNNIFEQASFTESLAIQLFRHQYQHNRLYNRWCTLTHVLPDDVIMLEQIPFLPVSFFKTDKVTTGSFEPQLRFSSSGTMATGNSQHDVKSAAIYRQSFNKAFTRFYGDIKNWCILGLLPSYLERDHSSLVYMVNDLIKESNHPQSGFYLYDVEKLYNTLQQLEAGEQPTLLIGVTYALLDFAQSYPMHLQHTTVMETGGMKGRKKEITRREVHQILQKQLSVNAVHSEYGMTELLSQAYAQSSGIFICPPWMKVLVRNEDDPLQISVSGSGILNIIDLANMDSCAFIATDDIGVVHANGSFEVQGRLDNSDIRGCSLLVV